MDIMEHLEEQVSNFSKKKYVRQGTESKKRIKKIGEEGIKFLRSKRLNELMKKIMDTTGYLPEYVIEMRQYIISGPRRGSSQKLRVIFSNSKNCFYFQFFKVITPHGSGTQKNIDEVKGEDIVEIGEFIIENCPTLKYFKSKVLNAINDFFDLVSVRIACQSYGFGETEEKTYQKLLSRLNKWET